MLVFLPCHWCMGMLLLFSTLCSCTSGIVTTFSTVPSVIQL